MKFGGKFIVMSGIYIPYFYAQIIDFCNKLEVTISAVLYFLVPPWCFTRMCRLRAKLDAYSFLQFKYGQANSFSN